MQKVLLLVVILGHTFSDANNWDKRHEKFVDGLVKHLIEVDPSEPRLIRTPPIDRWTYTDRDVTIGNQYFSHIDTGLIKWEGIKKLHRSSHAMGGWVRGMTQTVNKVDLMVPSGFNLTAADMTFCVKHVDRNNEDNEEECQEIEAKFAAVWNDSNVDALFKLQTIQYSTQRISLDWVVTNVDKSRFEVTLTCEDPNDQHLCDALLKNYINTWEFDLHFWVQKVLKNAIALVEYNF